MSRCFACCASGKETKPHDGLGVHLCELCFATPIYELQACVSQRAAAKVKRGAKCFICLGKYRIFYSKLIMACICAKCSAYDKDELLTLNELRKKANKDKVTKALEVKAAKALAKPPRKPKDPARVPFKCDDPNVLAFFGRRH